MMRARAAALATEPTAEAAAAEHLTGGGRALDAALAGFFAAAGNDPGVLLGPATVLVAGVGVGARAFDGRVRQPGLGAKRPRGFGEQENVPDSARVGAPTALAAALIAHAYSEASLRAVVRPGIVAAERANAEKRGRFLERVAQVGASVLLEATYRRGLLRVAAPSEGGLLTPKDLDAPQDLDVPAREALVGEGRFSVAPWALETPPAEPASGRGAAVLALDVQGTLAAVVYRVADRGVWVEELEMLAPFAAVPVRRGVPRVSPGARLPTPAPVAVRWDEAQGPTELLVDPQAALLDLARPAAVRWALRRNPATRLIESRRG